MTSLTLGIALILTLALLEAPLFTIIAGVSIACFYTDGGLLAVQTVIIEMNRLASMPVLVALPLFTLAGTILTESGAPRRIMALMQAAAGWLPGGPAVAALAACAFFTALTGASGVTIVALGSVLYPILREQRYGERFSLGLLTTGGSLGLLFAPSLPIILYGVVARVDIGAIFKAAVVPGIVLVLFLSGYAVVRETLRRRRPGVSGAVAESFSWHRLFIALRESAWDWPVLIIIVVGVFGGMVTIAEVSALVLAYVFVVSCLILKEVSITRTLPAVMKESAILSGAIIMILAMALGLTGYLVDRQVPEQILSILTAFTANRYVFLGGLNLFLLAVGCMMDIFSAIIIIVPIIAPVAFRYGINPIHLCIIFLVNLEIGYSTPPVGINLFISSLKFRKPVTLLYRASVPYLLLMMVFLILVTYWPALSLFLMH